MRHQPDTAALPIRAAHADDAPAISALILRNLAHLTARSDASGAEPFLRQITPAAVRALLENPAFRFAVAPAGTGLAGVVAVRYGRHLFHLFVAPEFQRQGLGRRLWQHALRDTLARAPVDVFTVNASVSAVPVYRHFGFAVCGERVEQHGVAFVPMRLAITPEDAPSHSCP